MTDHEWNESKQCKYCNCDYFSQDLKFTLSSSGTSYVVSGIGSCVDSDIIIPANYKGKPVVSIISEAFSGCDFITSVSIGRNIMSIGRYAFKDCSILKSITWDAENCTDAGLYGDSIFANCLNVTKATISNNVKTIPAFAFQGCKNLTSISIGNRVSSIKNSAFRYCSKLSYITVANDNQYFTSVAGDLCNKNKTVLIQYAIGKTNSSFTIPNSVTSIADFAFARCCLTKITIGNSVTSIGDWAFNECTNLTNVTIGNGVTSIGTGAFMGCNKLSDIFITDLTAWCNISGLSYLMNCSNSKYIYLNNKLIPHLVIPDDVTSIPDYAFYGCDDITSITINESVDSIGDCAFRNCRKLTSITVDNNNYFVSIDGNLYNKNKTKLIQYAIGKTDSSFTIPNGITSIDRQVFYGCNSLTNITIPDSVTYIGDYAFV